MRAGHGMRWPWRLAAAVALGAGLVTGAEVVLRAAAPLRPPGMFTPDPRLGFRLTPSYRGEQVVGATRIPLAFNALGLRDRELAPPPADVLRIFVLGDSFVFGHGVRAEETMTAVLERSLPVPPGYRSVEVINGGVPRYGTVQQAGLFEATVDAVRPAAVVLAVFVGNDALDNLAASDSRSPAGAGVAWHDWLRVRSEVYARLRQGRHRAGGRRDVLGREAFAVHAVSPRPDIERGLALTEAAIGELAARAAARGIVPALVLIPAAAQVYPERWEAAARAHGAAVGPCDPDQPNARLRAFATRRGLPVLDLAPALRAARAEPLYFALHWTPAGHRVAAAALGAFLEREGVLAAATGAAGRRAAPDTATPGGEQERA